MRGRREAPPPEEWDGGEWVDVGADGRWTPSFSERVRALVILGVAFGLLGILAAALSVGDSDDGEQADRPTPTTEPSSTTASTTTAPVDPTSVGGEPPPESCVFDDRQAMPLREPSAVTVVVLNGTPKGGHAGDVTAALEALGYETIEPGNAGRIATTRIDYRAGYCAEANRMISDLGVPTAGLYAMEPGSEAALSRSDLVVTMGRDSLDESG